MSVLKHLSRRRTDDREVLIISKQDKTTLEGLMTFLQCDNFISEKTCRSNADRLKELSTRHTKMISALSAPTEDMIMTSIRGLDNTAKSIIHEAIEGHRTGRLTHQAWMTQIVMYGVRAHLNDSLWFDRAIMNRILEATE